MELPAAVGLNNTGAICHFNSLLQMLMSSKELADIVKTMKPTTCTAKAIKTFFEKYHQGCPESVGLLQALMKDLAEKKPSIRFGNSQESATEGLVFLLEMIEGDRVREMFEHVYVMSIRCMECKQVVSQTRDKAVQFNTFVFDALKKYPDTPEEYSQHIHCNITELNDYRCEKCGTKNAKAIRIHQLARIGRLFVVVHNKYTKVKQRYFPEKFELPGVDGKPLKYKQLAQVEHSGGLHGGHYWAKVLRKEGTMRANDSHVSPDKFGPDSNVYMVLYGVDHS